MSTNQCPTQESLREYLLGDVDEAESSRIEDHLLSCEPCERTLALFDSSVDTVVRYIPLAASDISSNRPAWLDRLREQPPENSNWEEDKTNVDASMPGLLGSYELLSCIGRGGMGVVYRARHRQLNRVVALKVLSPNLITSQSARSRFDREIQILGGLNHPGIVQAIDAGRDGRVAFLVMEYIDGVNLSKIVNHKGPLSVGESCEAIRQAAKALDAAHALGAIHRDLKPSNFMVDRGGRVKLLDFGLAHLSDQLTGSVDTTVGRLLGTLDYMPPEQAGGIQSVDHRADIYGLGATLFFLLSGRAPHESDPDQPLIAKLKHISEGSAIRLDEIRAGVPSSLTEFIGDLLSADPSDRPESAADIAQELSRFADGNLQVRVAELAKELPPPDESNPNEMNAAEASLAELLGDSAHAIRPNSNPNAPWKTGTLTAVGLLGIAVVLYAITLLVHTPDGTLRIESDAPNVHVELIDDANESLPLEINKGDNRTSIEAGRYRIRFAGEHDRLRVTPENVVLHRGKETLARITYEKEKGPDENRRVPGDEPLFNGDPRSVWQDRFDRDLSSESRLKAANALVALTKNDAPRLKVERIVQIGGKINDAPRIVLNGGLQFSDEVLLPPVMLLGHQQPNVLILDESANRLRSLPVGESVILLAEQVHRKRGSEQAFAACLLVKIVTRKSIPAETGNEAATLLTDSMDEKEPTESFLRLLLAANIAPSNPDVKAWMTDAATLIRAKEDHNLLRRSNDAWLRRSLSMELNPNLIGDVMANSISVTSSPEILKAFSKFYWDHRTGSEKSWYYQFRYGKDPIVTQNSRAVFRSWPNIAAKKIIELRANENPDRTNFAMYNLYRTVQYALEGLPADQAVDYAPFVEALQDDLRLLFRPPNEPVRLQDTHPRFTANELLWLHWVATGTIPDFVRDSEPNSEQAVKQLKQFQLACVGRRFATTGPEAPNKKMFEAAPFHTTETLLLESEIRPHPSQLTDQDLYHHADDIFGGYSEAAYCIVTIIQEELKQSSEREQLFADVFFRLQYVLRAKASGPNLVAHRYRQVLLDIVEHATNPGLLKIAAGCVVSEAFAREELQNRLSARIRDNKMKTTTEAELYLTLFDPDEAVEDVRLTAIRFIANRIRDLSDSEIQRLLVLFADQPGVSDEELLRILKQFSSSKRKQIRKFHKVSKHPLLQELLQQADE